MSVNKYFYLLIFFSIGANASEKKDDWIEVANSGKNTWLAKKRTGSIGNLDDKKDSSYSYVVQKIDKKNEAIEYFKAVVELNSCKKGYGNVYYNSLEGKFLSKGQFVRPGTTVNDALGEMACYSWEKDTGKQSKFQTNDQWLTVATSKKSGVKYSIKNDTFYKTKYKNIPSISGLYRVQDSEKDETLYSELLISISDCKRGYGTIFDFDFSGNLKDKYDIVIDGDSVIATTATAICNKI